MIFLGYPMDFTKPADRKDDSTSAAVPAVRAGPGSGCVSPPDPVRFKPMVAFGP